MSEIEKTADAAVELAVSQTLELNGAKKEIIDLRAQLEKVTAERDEARDYGESAYGHDVACLEMAEQHERSGDLGARGLGGLLEFALTPPIVPPWGKPEL